MDVRGKNVVVTGKIAGESRSTAEQKLREAGANVQSSVGPTTDLLVTGDKVGKAKTDKAKALGVSIVPWEHVWAIGGAGGRLERFVETGDTAVLLEGLPDAPTTGQSKTREFFAEHPEAEAIVDDVFAFDAATATHLTREYGAMLAKAGPLPKGEQWLYEIKWDGNRCIANVVGGQVRMRSRSHKSEFSSSYPHVAAELAKMPDGVYDGELVEVNGVFGNGAATMKGKASFVIFDMLADGELGDLRMLMLADRRKILIERLAGAREQHELFWLGVSPAFDDGEQLLELVREHHGEGVVAKLRSSTYHEGSRSEVWTKVKIRSEQEFAVLGYTLGEGGRGGEAGSVVLGVRNPERGVWEFCGRAGTGQTAHRLPESFWFDVAQKSLPLEGRPLGVDTGVAPMAELRHVVWVVPQVVVQVQFQRWTEDGRLWHPSVVGVRTDKKPEEVTREP